MHICLAIGCGNIVADEQSLFCDCCEQQAALPPIPFLPPLTQEEIEYEAVALREELESFEW